MEEITLEAEQNLVKAVTIDSQMFEEPPKLRERKAQEAGKTDDLTISEEERTVAEEQTTETVKPEVQAADNGEDLLLEQIDAFRDKAKQLQSLISAKERKVKELEALVRAKEAKNQQLQEQNQRLQEELGKKRAQADGIVTDVEQQVDRMLQSVQGNMDKIEQRVAKRVELSHEKAREQTREAKETFDQAKSNMDAIHSGVETIGEQIARAREEISSVLTEVSQIRTDMETVKGELFEKVHSENVKVYRNVQDLMKEMDHSQEAEAEAEAKFKSVRMGLNAVTVLTVVNLAAAAVTLLNLFGII